MITDKTKWFFDTLDQIKVTPVGVGELLVKFLNKKPNMDELISVMVESIKVLKATEPHAP